jgi:putative endonuclease
MYMAQQLEYIVYILISKVDGRFLFGQTTDLAKSINAHNKGLSAYTKKYRPWQLFAIRKVETRSEAIQMEMELRKIKNENKVYEFMLYNEFLVSRDLDI